MAVMLDQFGPLRVPRDVLHCALESVALAFVLTKNVVERLVL